MLKNRTFYLFSLIGIIWGGLLVYALMDFPLLVLFLAVILLAGSFYFTQVNKTRIERGAVLTWFAAVAMVLVTMWVYQFFKWPPTILKVLLLNVQVLMTAEVLYVLSHYLFNLGELKNYLHMEIALIKIIQLIVSILSPLAAYGVISYDFANILSTICLVLIWIKISYEIVSMKYA